MFSIIVLTACASPIKKEIEDKYKGKEGYFSVAPSFGDIGSTKHVPGSELSGYMPCEKSIITGIRYVSPPLIYIDFKNNSKEFSAEWLMKNEEDLKLFFDNYFVSSIKIDERKVTTTSGTKTLKEWVCSKTVFMGMSKKEFEFIMGSPQKINTTTVRGAKNEQYVYESKTNRKERKYFYLVNEKLSSWQY